MSERTGSENETELLMEAEQVEHYEKLLVDFEIDGKHIARAGRAYRSIRKPSKRAPG